MKIKQLNLHDLKPELQIPEKDELHIWSIRTDPLDNLHKSHHKHSHALLRRIVAAYTGIEEEKLIFTTGEHGKPSLENVSFLNFNLSHSGEYIVFIFSCSFLVGIDIEQTGRKANMDKIAARIFLPSEAEKLKSLEGNEKISLFFQLWTRTESFLKGLGTGLSVSFKDENIQKEYSRWTIQYISAPEGYVCCTAFRPL